MNGDMNFDEARKKYHITSPTDVDYTEVNRLFIDNVKVYGYISDYVSRTEVPNKYISFDDDSEDVGIPKRIRVFKYFDPYNNKDLDPRLWQNYRAANIADYLHVKNYLDDPCWNPRLLRDQKYDAVVHAVVSYILEWDNASLLEFGKIINKHAPLTDTVLYERNEGKFVYRKRPENVPYTRLTFKIVSKYFKIMCVRDEALSGTRLFVIDKPFNLLSMIRKEFIDELQMIYQAILDQKVDQQLLDSMQKIRREELPDCEDKLGATWSDMKSSVYNPTCFITGQAACGKTTLLEILRKHGYKIMSRGRMGGQNGKCYDSFPIAALHATVDFVLNTYCDVIGVNFFPHRKKIPCNIEIRSYLYIYVCVCVCFRIVDLSITRCGRLS